VHTTPTDGALLGAGSKKLAPILMIQEGSVKMKYFAEPASTGQNECGSTCSCKSGEWVAPPHDEEDRK